MSGSYWKVGDKVNIGQSDIEISCEGGKEYKENQVIGIYIPPSVKFFSGKDSVLQFDLKIESTATTKLCLDGTIGAHGLFSRVACYAGNRTELLEELTEYDSFVNIKYSYDTSEASRAKRALTEGCGAWTPDTRGTLGTTKSHQSNVVSSPFNENVNKGKDPQTIIDSESGQITARITMPLYMGCWANSTKAFPNLLTNGIFIELTCNAARKCVKVYDQTTLARRISFNPVYASTDGSTGVWKHDDASDTDTLFCSNQNSQLDPTRCPFNKGETIGLWDRQLGVEFTVNDAMIIKSIDMGNTANKQSVKITLETPTKPAGTGELAASANRYVFFSKERNASFSPSYTIINPKMVVRALDMGAQYEKGMIAKMKQGGVIMFDLPSVACSLQSVGANEVQATIPISCEHAKARSLICMGTDSKPYSAQESCDSTSTYLINETETNDLAEDKSRNTNSQQSGYSGCGDSLSSYSFMISGVQTPARRIECKKTTGTGAGIDQNHLIELEKSLQQAHGCTPRSFVNYQNNFLIGRALTLDSNTIFDGRNKDLRLNLSYEEAVPASRVSRKEKLWKIFTSHIKTILIKGNSIQVQN
tara:strand:+ start:8582 stop:10351 length:1770 start_codon:yes stop_codon:yes gene_type:complete